ncbi:hypothetical protein BC567DRAFT_234065 [Phyllosticta citribraziliensis]
MKEVTWFYILAVRAFWPVPRSSSATTWSQRKPRLPLQAAPHDPPSPLTALLSKSLGVSTLARVCKFDACTDGVVS